MALRHLAASFGLVVTGGSDFHADPAHHANVLGGVSLSVEGLRRSSSAHKPSARGSRTDANPRDVFATSLSAASRRTARDRRYQSLRPLRLQSLSSTRASASRSWGSMPGPPEVLVNLVTGAALPDEGTVRVLGRDTADITGDDWLASLDRFGIVSPRAVLIEAATIEENLAMPFTLQIDPIPPSSVEVARSRPNASISADTLKQTTSEASPAVRTRLHFARALAPKPILLLLEHPTAALPDAAHSVCR